MRNFSEGQKVRCYGELRLANKVKEMVHPECEFIDRNNIKKLDEYLTPVYPITEGLQQHRIRNIVRQSLAMLKSGKISFPEILPKKILENYIIDQDKKLPSYLS